MNAGAMAKYKGKIVKGSVADVAASKGGSLAAAFLDCELCAIVDWSGSMDGDPKVKALKALADLQAANPGKVAVVSFSDDAQFEPGGVPEISSSGTNLAGALEYVKEWDGVLDFCVISDGVPNDPPGALAVAKGMRSKISCVFIGREGDEGQKFLAQLAKAKGGIMGTTQNFDKVKALVEQVLALPAGRR